MNNSLQTWQWEEYRLGDLFFVKAGKYYYDEEYSIGKTPYISATNVNNGVSKYIDLDPDFSGNCLVIGKVGCTTFYQEKDFCATSDVNILIPKKIKFNREIGLFICTIINKSENYKWSYGRQCRVNDVKNIYIKLPSLLNSDGSIKVDEDLVYSPLGYIPDTDYMENFIKSLKNRPITTKVSKSIVDFSSDQYKLFKISELFEVKYGINLELNKCQICEQNEINSVNFVARTKDNNGVVARVKKIPGVEPQIAGTITVAGGGSVLSSFVQTDNFYSGRDLYLLIPREELSLEVKLYVCTLIAANKYRYSYGRQANKTLKDLEISLPITKEKNPDWKNIESFIRSLPYSDRIIKRR